MTVGATFVVAFAVYYAFIVGHFRLLQLFFWLLFLFFLFGVGVLQIPFHEDILLLELPVFLLVSPDVDKRLASDAEDAVKFSDCLNS